MTAHNTAPVGEPVHYSLWLVPRCPSPHDELKSVIDTTAAEVLRSCGVSCPTFEPHATVVSNWSMPLDAFVAQSNQLAAMLRSIPPYDAKLSGVRLTFRGVERGSDRYRCVFLRGDDTANSDYLSLTAEGLKQLFGTDAKLPPFTHISLLYDVPKDDTEWQRRLDLVSRIVGPVPLVVPFYALQVVQILPGRVEDWKSVATIPL